MAETVNATWRGRLEPVGVEGVSAMWRWRDKAMGGCLIVQVSSGGQLGWVLLVRRLYGL